MKIAPSFVALTVLMVAFSACSRVPTTRDEPPAGAETTMMRADTTSPVVPPAPATSPGPPPAFADYPARTTLTGPPAAPLLGTAPYGRVFRTKLREGAREGPNFAGDFTVVLWGCGSGCQIVSIVDARTGRLSRQTLHTMNGVTFQRDSRLLIADPIDPANPPPEQCASCGTPAAYVWEQDRLRPLGPGPHPHLEGDRPW